MSIYGEYFVPDHMHRFDPVSGWCNWAGADDQKKLVTCGQREDGRTVNRNGVIVDPGPGYTLEQLEIFRQRASQS